MTGGHTPTVNSGRLRPPAGHYVVLAGSTIAAALVTGLSSDLPGEVVAQVTEDVFELDDRPHRARSAGNAAARQL